MIKKKAFNSSIVYVVIFILAFVVLSIFQSIKFFSRRELKQIWTTEISTRINCHTVSNSGDFVGVGDDTGICYVYDQNGKKVFEKKFPFPILSLKFSNDRSLLYVRGNTLFAIDLLKQKVVWEKFKKGYLVRDFWVFRDGKCSILYKAEKDITLIYQYMDKMGQTIKENTLPEIFGNYSCSPSSDGKYFLVSLLEGDLYLFQSDSVVVWNIHLDPSVKEISVQYPILHLVANNGSVFLAYTGEEYGKELHIVQMIDRKSDTIWKNFQAGPITEILLSPDEMKLLVTTDSKFLVYEVTGKTQKILYSLDQYGYKPNSTRLGTTNVLYGFISSEVGLDNNKPSVVYKLISLNQKRVLWQKRTKHDVFDFSVANKGYVFVEISLHSVKYFRYVLN